MRKGIGCHADGKGRSQAGMGAIAKCQQVMIVVSVDVEGFGCGKFMFIPVRCRYNDEEGLPFFDQPAIQIDIPGGDSAGIMNRRIITKYFRDEFREE